MMQSAWSMAHGPGCRVHRSVCRQRPLVAHCCPCPRLLLGCATRPSRPTAAAGQGPPGTGCTLRGTQPSTGDAHPSTACAHRGATPSPTVPSVQPLCCAHPCAVCTPLCVQPLHGVQPMLCSPASPPPPALQRSGCLRLAAGSRAPGCCDTGMPPPSLHPQGSSSALTQVSGLFNPSPFLHLPAPARKDPTRPHLMGLFQTRLYYQGHPTCAPVRSWDCPPMGWVGRRALEEPGPSPWLGDAVGHLPPATMRPALIQALWGGNTRPWVLAHGRSPDPLQKAPRSWSSK